MCSSAVTSRARHSLLDSVLAVAVDMDHVAVVMPPGARPGVWSEPRLAEGSALDAASLAITRCALCGGGGDTTSTVLTCPPDRVAVAL